MWRQSLINSGFKTLLFNAWENDFTDDAFISLIGEFELGIAALNLDSNHASEATKHLNKAKKIGASIVKRSLPTAVKLMTAGLIDLDDISEEALAAYSEKLVEEQVKRYEEAKKSVLGFKEELASLASALNSNDENRPLPLIVFIDELDRCRPPYAIKVLEAVKHFFSVPNVVFILSLDKVFLRCWYRCRRIFT